MKSEIGKKGEEIAVSYLIKKGYKIQAVNFRCPFGEIDIIARDKKVIAFIEVKTRMSRNFGAGKEAVDYNKQLRINRVALYYMNSQNKAMEEEIWRFDVVSVSHDQKEGWSVELIKNAFPALYIEN